MTLFGIIKVSLIRSFLGKALHELEQYEEAIICFTQAINLNPKDDTFWMNNGIIFIVLGMALLELEEYEESINNNS